MSKHILKIQEAYYITQDVKRFILDKPEGFTFIPGQAGDFSINKPGWEDQKRPFTFTSLNSWPFLELTVKIYNQRNGMTHELGRTNSGAELIIDDVFGAIQYKGPGVFLAGGSGITPFMAILRQLHAQKQLHGNSLIYSNKYEEDVIFDSELRQMLGNSYLNVLTREDVVGFGEKRIDRDFLIENIRDFGQNFYVCGPDKFVTTMCDILIDLGADPEALVFEK
jgi:ferredoxin-NADP reductase